MKITVALCTRRRPVMLRRVLDAMSRLDTKGFALSLVVVENDDAPQNRALVESYGNQLDIRYVHEPRQGLCFARNRAFEEALKESPDWVATTDDDTWPEPDWLERMLELAAARPEADAIAGQTRPIGPEPGKWSLPRLDARRFETGARATYMSTSNFFIRRSVLEEGFRFDPAYNLSGGEDTEFLRGLRVAGKVVLWTNDAIVNSPVTSERQGLRYKIRRVVTGYSQMPSIRRKYDGPVMGTLKTLRRIIRLVVRALGWLLAGLVGLALRREAGPRDVMQALNAAAMAAGLFLGMVGYRAQPYRKTDGH